MIKGIFIKNKAGMENITLSDVICEFDPLKTKDSSISINDSGYIIKRDTYYSDDLYFTIINVSGNSEVDMIFKAIYKLYDIVQIACPDFLKMFPYGENTILVAYPKYENESEDKAYTIAYDEILRVTAFLAKLRPDNIVEEVREYYKSYVIYGE